MDPRKNMIIDLEKKGNKRMFVTEQVVHISENNNGLWAVKFSTSQRIFNYNKSRLLYLTNPISVDLIEKGLYIKNRHITHVSELLKFDDGRHVFYHVVYNNGFTENLDGNDVYVTRTPIDKNGGTTWEYLNKLATETGLMTEEGDNILALQYGIIDVKRDNVPLAQYLGDKTKLATFRAPNTIYYPFGCNASQKKAVENALTNQVSIIQGPPGTGKTQTILNIIANLLLEKKSVLVVSNNNSAVENVAEKLEVEGLGFLVAKLGSVENKELFIVNQKEYPQMDDWRIEDTSSIKQQVKQALRDASLGFEGQSKFALLKTELDALHKETKYDQMHHDVADEHKWLFYKHSKKLMSFRLQYGILTEKGQKSSLLRKLKWSFTLGFKVYKFLKEKPETIPNVNDVVNMYPSMHKGSCCFVGQYGNSFYPLNVVLELEEKNMINKLIELGAYKLAEGSFKDLRNPDKYQTKHSLDRLFRYCCDDAHYNMLKKNFKENSEWNETLEKLFPNK